MVSSNFSQVPSELRSSMRPSEGKLLKRFTGGWTGGHVGCAVHDGPWSDVNKNLKDWNIKAIMFLDNLEIRPTMSLEVVCPLKQLVICPSWTCV